LCAGNAKSPVEIDLGPFGVTPFAGPDERQRQGRQRRLDEH
jgi:hypothetical protein